MGCFGRSVGCATFAVHGVHAGGDAYYSAPALGQHVGHYSTGHVEGAAAIHRDNPIPFVGGNLPEVIWRLPAHEHIPRCDTGVVDQDMKPAQLFDCPLYGTLGFHYGRNIH